MASGVAANVLAVLSAAKRPLAAKDIVKELAVRGGQQPVVRSEVNRALYRELIGKVVADETQLPPLWSVASKSQTDDDAKQKDDEASLGKTVMVDLGNVHDCLPKLVPYAQSGDIEVVAYADVGFSGYGIKPPAPPPIVVKQASSFHKNAADIDLIFDLAVMGMQLNQKGVRRHFIIATLDKGFYSIKEKLEALGHKVKFVTNWDDLRMEIE